jgi:class 3 adenylate cyclase
MANHRTLTIAFADMREFMVLIRAVGWERAIAATQTAMEAIGDIVIQHGGQIRKYLGDAVLMSFADARPAIAAARAIAQYRQVVDNHEIRFGVGVATGEVLVTPFGHATNRIEDVFGDPVIRALDLLKEAHTHPDGMALDDETRKHG